MRLASSALLAKGRQQRPDTEPSFGAGAPSSSAADACPCAAASLQLPATLSRAAPHAAAQLPLSCHAGSMAILPTTAPIAFSRATAQTQLPGPLWGTLKPPLPTNAWWENLVLAAGDQPVAPYPYLVSALGNVCDFGRHASSDCFLHQLPRCCTWLHQSTARFWTPSGRGDGSSLKGLFCRINRTQCQRAIPRACSGLRRGCVSVLISAA